MKNNNKIISNFGIYVFSIFFICIFATLYIFYKDNYVTEFLYEYEIVYNDKPYSTIIFTKEISPHINTFNKLSPILKIDGYEYVNIKEVIFLKTIENTFIEKGISFYQLIILTCFITLVLFYIIKQYKKKLN